MPDVVGEAVDVLLVAVPARQVGPLLVLELRQLGGRVERVVLRDRVAWPRVRGIDPVRHPDVGLPVTAEEAREARVVRAGVGGRVAAREAEIHAAAERDVLRRAAEHHRLLVSATPAIEPSAVRRSSATTPSGGSAPGAFRSDSFCTASASRRWSSMWASPGAEALGEGRHPHRDPHPHARLHQAEDERDRRLVEHRRVPGFQALVSHGVRVGQVALAVEPPAGDVDMPLSDPPGLTWPQAIAASNAARIATIASNPPTSNVTLLRRPRARRPGALRARDRGAVRPHGRPPPPAVSNGRNHFAGSAMRSFGQPDHLRRARRHQGHDVRVPSPGIGQEPSATGRQ